MKITREEVAHIAALSRLAFTPEETEAMRSHLESVLGHFERLDSVDTSVLPPTAHILDTVNVLREDAVRPPMDRDALLRNAPETDGAAYIVPRVLE